MRQRSRRSGKEDVIATIHLDVEGVNRVGHLVSQALSVSGITAVGSLNVQDGVHIIHELLVGHVGKRGLNNHHLSLLTLCGYYTTSRELCQVAEHTFSEIFSEAYTHLNGIYVELGGRATPIYEFFFTPPYTKSYTLSDTSAA